MKSISIKYFWRTLKEIPYQSDQQQPHVYGMLFE